MAEEQQDASAVRRMLTAVETARHIQAIAHDALSRGKIPADRVPRGTAAKLQTMVVVGEWRLTILSDLFSTARLKRDEHGWWFRRRRFSPEFLGPFRTVEDLCDAAIAQLADEPERREGDDYLGPATVTVNP